MSDIPMPTSATATWRAPSYVPPPPKPLVKERRKKKRVREDRRDLHALRRG